MRIRELSEADLDQAVCLERECFGSQAWSGQALLDAVRNENALYLAAFETCAPADSASTDSVLAGCCGVWLSFEEGEIMNVAVRKEYRRKGVAGKLMKELLSRAEKRGAARFILEVREGNLPAVRLYESLGFLHAGFGYGILEVRVLLGSIRIPTYTSSNPSKATMRLMQLSPSTRRQGKQPITTRLLDSWSMSPPMHSAWMAS